MAAKKTISKVKAFGKKVIKELRKKKPDFTTIENHFTSQTLLINALRFKMASKPVAVVKIEKPSIKKVAVKKAAPAKKKR